MKKLLSLVVIGTVAALLLGSGTATAQSIDAGRGELPLTVPSTYADDSAVPLIVLLHTYGRTGAIQDDYMSLSALADDYGFIMVAPDGTLSDGPNNPRYWNASAACCAWGDNEKLDDSGYIASIIDMVKSEYQIDPKRVYVIGHSNGAFMAHRLAHDHSGIIAAIVSIAGADQSVERPAPPHPVHVLQIHGTADEAIAYGGAEIQGEGYPGAKQSVQNWAARNGCEDEGSNVGMLDLVSTLDGLDSIVTRYTNGCKAGGAAALWTMVDGGHVPELSDHFTRLVVEWLLAHPKP